MSTYFQSVAPGVCFSQMPNRASDAGPEPTAAPDFDQLCDAAIDEVYAARHLSRPDNATVERKLRRESLEAARDLLTRALEAL